MVPRQAAEHVFLSLFLFLSLNFSHSLTHSLSIVHISASFFWMKKRNLAAEFRSMMVCFFLWVWMREWEKRKKDIHIHYGAIFSSLSHSLSDIDLFSIFKWTNFSFLHYHPTRRSFYDTYCLHSLSLSSVSAQWIYFLYFNLDMNAWRENSSYVREEFS
jgi:hypothetical protein